MKCTQWNSTDILEKVGVLDRGHNNHKSNLTIVMQKDPNALMFKGNIEAPLHANVCESCGFVMLFANPKDVAMLKYGDSPSL